MHTDSTFHVTVNQTRTLQEMALKSCSDGAYLFWQHSQLLSVCCKWCHTSRPKRNVKLMFWHVNDITQQVKNSFSQCFCKTKEWQLKQSDPKHNCPTDRFCSVWHRQSLMWKLDFPILNGNNSQKHPFCQNIFLFSLCVNVSLHKIHLWQGNTFMKMKLGKQKQKDNRTLLFSAFTVSWDTASTQG